MPKLPQVSGDELRKALERDDWQFRRQSGSHMVLTKDGMPVSLAIPRHRELAPGTLRRVIRDAGISVDRLIELLG